MQSVKIHSAFAKIPREWELKNNTKLSSKQNKHFPRRNCRRLGTLRNSSGRSFACAQPWVYRKSARCSIRNAEIRAHRPLPPPRDIPNNGGGLTMGWGKSNYREEEDAHCKLCSACFLCLHIISSDRGRDACISISWNRRREGSGDRVMDLSRVLSMRWCFRFLINKKFHLNRFAILC